MEITRTGSVALVGRPNVGKSTLLNALVGQKLSITSRRPQTTRIRLQGILTLPTAQIVFVDTPGFQQRHGGMIYRSMNRAVADALESVDQVLMVVEALRWNEADAAILARLETSRAPWLLINKTDRLRDPAQLADYAKAREADFSRFAEIFPVSAQQPSTLQPLLNQLAARLPEGPFQFDPEQVSDRPERFFVAEFIREQLFRQLGDELPYATAVLIDKYEQTPGLTRIEATLLVDNAGQKAILIGDKGQRMKAIGTAARLQIEQFLGTRVYLGLWAKIKAGWAEDGHLLKQLGHDF